MIREFVNRKDEPKKLEAARVEAASEEDRLSELEREVRELKNLVGFMKGDGSLTGQNWNLDWANILWGKDGPQVIQKEHIADCPEWGFTTWHVLSNGQTNGNSNGKISARRLVRQPNGEVAVIEIAIIQTKVASGRQSNAGSDEVGSLEGIVRVDLGDGEGSQDADMKFATEISLQEFLSSAPFKVGDRPADLPEALSKPPANDMPGDYAVGLIAPGREVTMELQGSPDGTAQIVLYDIRNMKDGVGGVAIGRVPIQKF
jgi:hypothetical protein